jgi:transcriptional regulator with XRE-family HTH domain
MSIDRTDPESVRDSPNLSPNGALVKRLRKARRLTQLQLAVLADVSERTVRRAEASQPVRMQSLELLATVLEADFFDLVDNAEQYRRIRSEQRKLDRVLEGLRTAVVDHDFGCFEEAFDDNIQLDVAGPAEIPFVGQFRGHAAIRSMILEITPTVLTYEEPPLFGRVAASGDLVVLSGIDKVRLLKTNRVIQGRWQHVYEFEKGKVVHCQELFDSHVVLEGLNGNV